MRSVETLNGSSHAQIIIHSGFRKRKPPPAIELAFEVEIRILDACISDIGSQRHRVEWHLQIYRNIFQLQVMQRYPPVDSGLSRIFRSLGSIGKHYLHMGIAQFHIVQYGILFFQVDAMAFKEEPPECPFDVHSFQQIGRIYGNLLQGYGVHLYPALQ